MKINKIIKGKPKNLEQLLSHNNENNFLTSEYEQQSNPIVFNLSQKIENYNENNLINSNQNQPNINDINGNVPKDGNCLFWATMLAYLEPIKNNENEFKKRYLNIFGNKKNWKKIFNFSDFNFEDNKDLVLLFRKNVVEYMKNNPEEFKEFITKDIYENYLIKMKNDGIWGGELEIKAISHLLKTKIIVHKINENNILFSTNYRKFANNDFDSEIKIIHVDNNHYQYIKMINSQMNIENKPHSEVTQTQTIMQKLQKSDINKSLDSNPIIINVTQQATNHNENNLINNYHNISINYIKGLEIKNKSLISEIKKLNYELNKKNNEIYDLKKDKVNFYEHFSLEIRNYNLSFVDNYNKNINFLINNFNQLDEIKQELNNQIRNWRILYFKNNKKIKLLIKKKDKKISYLSNLLEIKNQSFKNSPNFQRIIKEIENLELCSQVTFIKNNETEQIQKKIINKNYQINKIINYLENEVKKIKPLIQNSKIGYKNIYENDFNWDEINSIDLQNQSATSGYKSNLLPQ